MSDKTLELAFQVIFNHIVLRRACELQALVERRQLMSHYGDNADELDSEIEKALNAFFYAWIDHTADVGLTGR